MLVNAADLAAVHRYCSDHRELMDRSSQAGCIQCGATFAPSEVREWIRAGDGRTEGETAKCPRCGTDAVLPSAAPVALTPAMLSALQRYWFSGTR
jgi:DNA-directed RNA polymerase subunit RPC12/RpoP